MNTHDILFSLDLDRQDSQVYVNVRKGEKAARLAVMLTGSCAPYSITNGVAAKLYAEKPDGTYRETACTIADGKITVTLVTEHTQTAGRFRAYFVLTQGESALPTPSFTINVEDPAE